MAARILVAILVAALAAGLASRLGAPSVAAALTGALGAATLWFARKPRPPAPPPPTPEPPSNTFASDMDTLFATIDDPLLIVDRQTVARANQAALTLLGAYIEGENVRLAIRHPAAAERLAGTVADTGPIELVGVGEPDRRWELSVHRLDSRRRLVRLRDRTGAHAAERMRVDFVANASHELRTPLAALIGFIETLEDGNAAEDAATRARFLKIMMGEAKRMQRLVEDLISLSRIEADRFIAPQEQVPLAALAEEVAATFRSTTPDGADRLRIMAPPDLPPVIGDRAQLSQLLHNLIGNALKYGRLDGPVNVTLARVPDAMIGLAVADRGEGIAPEHIPRLTERFYRADPGRSRALGGTGLGLAIVKHIVERHRGRLDIASVVGAGTTVTVLIPAAPERVS